MARKARVFNDTIIASATWAQSKGQTIILDGYDRIALQVNYSNATPGAKTFVVLSQAAGTLTISNHGFVTGLVGQASTSSALPTGLSTSTNYYVIVVDANTIALASSLANAVAGTAIVLSSNGTGTQTFTPTASAGNIIKAQGSIDGSNWTDLTTTNFPNLPNCTVTVSTSTGSTLWDLQEPSFKFVNIQYTPSAGQITFSVRMDAKNWN